jgi:glycosyltransferase involved in cell wall biosynthesis
MPNPLVSICVPTYNRAVFLQESLQTIRAQDYIPLEILISDNCSDDETEEVCHKIVRVDPRVRYVRQARNIGLYANHNFCVDESRGEFLCFFHDDDRRDSCIVSEYVSFLFQYPEVGIVCSDWELINDAGERIGVRDHKVKPIMSGLEYIEQTLRSGRSAIAAQGAMIRRSALGDIRFYEQGPIGFGDFVVWFQIAERATVGHINRRLWSCRLQRQSLSRRTVMSLTHDYYENLTRYCNAHLERWPEHVEMVSSWKAYIKRYLFWALMYEVGLHFRSRKPPQRFRDRTVFEIADYRLTPEEFRQVLEQLKVYRSGSAERIALFILNALLRVRFTWPLPWITRYSSLLRSVLGLR